LQIAGKQDIPRIQNCTYFLHDIRVLGDCPIERYQILSFCTNSNIKMKLCELQSDRNSALCKLEPSHINAETRHRLIDEAHLTSLGMEAIRIHD